MLVLHVSKICKWQTYLKKIKSSYNLPKVLNINNVQHVNFGLKKVQDVDIWHVDVHINFVIFVVSSMEHVIVKVKFQTTMVMMTMTMMTIKIQIIMENKMKILTIMYKPCFKNRIIKWKSKEINIIERKLYEMKWHDMTWHENSSDLFV
jgi:hypothetical protein